MSLKSCKPAAATSFVDVLLTAPRTLPGATVAAAALWFGVATRAGCCCAPRVPEPRSNCCCVVAFALRLVNCWNCFAARMSCNVACGCSGCHASAALCRASQPGVGTCVFKERLRRVVIVGFELIDSLLVIVAVAVVVHGSGGDVVAVSVLLSRLLLCRFWQRYLLP